MQLNRDKTVFMMIGRRKPKRRLTVGGEAIKLSKQMKYLGVVLDGGLNWLRHLKFLKDKVEKLVTHVRRLSWMSQHIRLSDKLKLYNSAFLQTVGYAADVWLEQSKKKPTYTKLLNSLQHRFITAMTGAYRCTNRQRLLKLIGIPEITEDLELMREKRQLELENRREYVELRRSEMTAGLPGFEQSYDDVGNITHRYVIWCITNTGPFRSTLNKIGLADDPSCRFCGFENESSYHLLRDCECISHLYTNLHPEQSAINLVKHLLKNQ